MRQSGVAHRKKKGIHLHTIFSGLGRENSNEQRKGCQSDFLIRFAKASNGRKASKYSNQDKDSPKSSNLPFQREKKNLRGKTRR